MRLFLIRHPPPAVAAGICYGATDLPLADDPTGHAAALAPLLPPAIPLFSSPMTRCRLLAERLHPQPVFDARLRELDFGEWEMRPWEALDRGLLEAWAANPLRFRPPGGEAVADLVARVRGFLAAAPEEAIIVAHAGVLKACVGALAGITDWFGLRFDYGTVSLIENGALTWHNRRGG